MGTFLMKGKEPNASFLIFEQNEQTSLERLGFHQMNEPGKKVSLGGYMGYILSWEIQRQMTTTT